MTPRVGPPWLSKSRFMAGMQCYKRLYFEVHNPELAGVTEESDIATRTVGYEVGGLARERYPGGILIDHDYLHRAEAESATQAALRDLAIPAIYEGAFSFDR